MRAVIIPEIDLEQLEPLSQWRAEYTFPVVNKAIVEHTIELLYRHDIKDILLVMRHMPFETESYFGDGARWGVEISYALERVHRGFGESLKRIRNELGEPFLYLSGNALTNVDIGRLTEAHHQTGGIMTLATPDELEFVAEVVSPADLETIPGISAAVIEPVALNHLADHASATTIRSAAMHLRAQNQIVTVFTAPHQLETPSTFSDLSALNRKVLHGEIPGVLIPGWQLAKNVWVGLNSKIHPRAKIEAPVVIGDQCNIQAGATLQACSVLENGVIVAEDASISDSLLMSNTYVGTHVEVSRSIVNKNNILDVENGTTLFIADDFIIGDTQSFVFTYQLVRVFNVSVAAALFLLFLPIISVLYVYHLLNPGKEFFRSVSCWGEFRVVDLTGKREAKEIKLYLFRSKGRLFRKLPGLVNVIKGDINLVGVTPLSAKRAKSLSEDWETIRFTAPVGLFHFWETESRGEALWEERMVMEAYYANTHTFWLDMKVLFKSLNPFY